MGQIIHGLSYDDFRSATDAFCRRCYGFSLEEITEFPLSGYFQVGHGSLETAHAAARFRARG